MSDRDFSRYDEHRSGAEMQRLLHHGHWVPVLRGYTRAYVEQHFPGWTWNRLLDVCRSAGIVDPASGGDRPLRCDDCVVQFHFTDRRSFAVEWDDGTVSTS